MRHIFLNGFEIKLTDAQQKALADGKTVTSWIQIFRPGKWNHPRYGELQFNDKIFNDFVTNFDNKVRKVDLAIDQEHEPEKGATAWIKQLANVKTPDAERKEVGLWALVEWTKWGLQLVSDKVFRYLSGDFDYEWQDEESGKKFKNVLFGAALTNRPFIKGMSPINLSEFKDELEKDENIRNSFQLAEDILKLKEGTVAKTDDELMKMDPKDMTPEDKARYDKLCEANKLAERAKKVGLKETSTLAEVEAAEKKLADEIKIKNENLIARAKAVGLPEDSNEETIAKAEEAAKKKADEIKASEEKAAKELSEKAVKLGLSEKATKAEVEAKEKELNEKKAKEEADKLALNDIPTMEKKLSELKEAKADALVIRLMEENIANVKKLAENKLKQAKESITTMLKEHFRAGKLTGKERETLSAVLCADVESSETSFELSEKDKDGKDVKATKTLCAIIDGILKERPAIIELKDLAEKELKEPPKDDKAKETEKELAEVGAKVAGRVTKATKTAKALAEKKAKENQK